MMNRSVALAFAGSVGVLMLFAAGPLKLDKMGMRDDDPGPRPARRLSDDDAETAPARALEHDLFDDYNFMTHLDLVEGSHGGFSGQALAPGGRVILVPKYADKFGIFHMTHGGLELIDMSSHFPESSTSSAYMFWGAASAPDGMVIFVPYRADAVVMLDVYNDSSIELVDISAQIQSDWKFVAAAMAHNSEMIFAPSDVNDVGIFDPASKTFDLVDISGQIQGESKFSDVVAAPNGKMIFVPFKANAVGIFDPVSRNFESVDISSQINGVNKFGHGTLAPNGKIIFAPFWADAVGIFDPDSRNLELFDISAQISSPIKFYGATLAHTGKVVFAPFATDVIGIFDPEIKTFEAVNISGFLMPEDAGKYLFLDAIMEPNGLILMAPHEVAEFGILFPNEWMEHSETLPDPVPTTTPTTSAAPGTFTTTSMLKLKLKLKVKGKLRAWLKVKIANGHVNATAKVKSGRRRR